MTSDPPKAAVRVTLDLEDRRREVSLSLLLGNGQPDADLNVHVDLTTVGRAGAASAIITRVIAACESRGIAVEDDIESIVGGLVESIYPTADLFDRLVNGPDEAIGALPTSTGDVAGVFTIWYQGELVHFGRATDTADTKKTNDAQADGVRGRVKSVARQPGPPLQRRLQRRFPADWAAATGTNDQKRASDLLQTRGRCRIVRCDSTDEAHAAYRELVGRFRTMIGE